MEGDKWVNDPPTGPWFSAFSDGHFTKAEKSAFLPTCLMKGKNCNSALGVEERQSSIMHRGEATEITIKGDNSYTIRKREDHEV